MIPWKSRLYAFILKRALGPWLDANSLRLLHECIQLDVSAGQVTLQNIALNVDYIQEQLLLHTNQSDNSNNSNAHHLRGIQIEKVEIASLQISLSIREPSSTTTTSPDANNNNNKNGSDNPNTSSTLRNNTSEPAQQQQSSSSLAWRMVELGSGYYYNNNGSSAVALVAHVQVRGVVVQVAPNSNNHHQHPDEEETPTDNVTTAAEEIITPDAAPLTTTEPPPKGMVAAYLEAALASLRLSVECQDVQLVVVDNNSNSNTESHNSCCNDDDDEDESTAPSTATTTTWLKLHVQELRYREVEPTTTSLSNKEEAADSISSTSTRSSSSSSKHQQQQPAETPNSRWISIEQVSLSLGESSTTTTSQHSSDVYPVTLSSSRVALLEGTNTIRWQLFPMNNAAATKIGQGDDNVDATIIYQNDVQVQLNRQNVLVDLQSIGRVQTLVGAYYYYNNSCQSTSITTTDEQQETTSNRIITCAALQPQPSSQASSTFPTQYVNNSEVLEDEEEEDLAMLDGIMKQFNEAKRLAEEQMIRGGLLLPTVEEGGQVTFDTFFDANDQSLYSSVVLAHTSGNSSSLRARATSAKEASEALVHTKLRLNLAHGSVKLSFGKNSSSTNTTTSSIDEYMLVTCSDGSVSVAASAAQVEIATSLNRLQVEDAVMLGVRDDGNLQRLRRGLQIGNILQFPLQQHQQCASAAAEPTLLEAPCISLSLRRSADASLELEVTLEAVEITNRARTMANLTDFASTIKTITASKQHQQQSVEEEIESETPHMIVSVSCPSISCRAPLLTTRSDWSRLYARCGLESLQRSEEVQTESCCFEIVLEGLFLEMDTKPQTPGAPTISFLCNNIIGSTVHTNNHIRRGIEGQTVRRFPIFALAGRAEVNPVIPVSVRFFSPVQEGDTMFPTVPAIETFKARQEDEEEQIDRLLNNGGNYCRDLRGQNPQPEMMANAEKCASLLQVTVPSLVGDVTGDEVEILMDMLACMDTAVRDSGQVAVSDSPHEGGRNFPVSPGIALSLSIDRVSLSLHDHHSDEGHPSHSFSIESSRIRLHALGTGTENGQARLIMHDLDVYEVHGLARIISCTNEQLDDVTSLFQRSLAGSETCEIAPIVHRSHLFNPISNESPVLLFDIMLNEPSQMKVHMTMYDLTLRLNYDSKWTERMQNLIARFSDSSVPATDSQDHQKERDMVARLFFSLADCNIDYQSSILFRTPSRTIVRLGDIRLSSNLVFPAASVQTINLSFGDLSVYLCSNRFRYNFEDSRTLVSGSPNRVESSSEKVLQSMNYRSILTLDAANAVLAFSRLNDGNEPTIRASFTVGQVCLFACKDSFTIFISTVGELVDDLTALSDEQLDRLRGENRQFKKKTKIKRSPTDGTSCVTAPHSVIVGLPSDSHSTAWGESSKISRDRGFLLDGYDWTTIDSAEPSPSASVPPGEEQVAKWYGSPLTKKGPMIVTHHFPLQPRSDPVLEGDMGAAQLTGLEKAPPVKMRVTVLSLKVKLRFFDGYDWPELLTDAQCKRPQNKSFVIHNQEEHTSGKGEKEPPPLGRRWQKSESNSIDNDKTDRKAMLMGDLLKGIDDDVADTFQDTPLPEERGAALREAAQLRKLARKTDKYFQVAASGISIRLDSLEESSDHQLASCLCVNAQDFFLAETISSSRPVKMVGEWFNEVDHPRDTNDGVFMMKMATWHPDDRVRIDNSIANDICDGVMKILPLRCFMDQGAMFFVREFFNPDNSSSIMAAKKKDDDDDKRHRFPPPLFRSFRVKPFKVKANYTPQRLDRRALRDGAFVELANLSPIDDMVLTIKGIEVENKVGLGEVMSILVSSWIQDIVRTQLIKFVTNIRPLEPISQVGETAVDMVVLPWEALRNGESVQRAIRSGAGSFASTLVFEAVEVSSRVAEYFANAVGYATNRGMQLSNAGTGGITGSTTAHDDHNRIPRSCLPSRPLETPRGVMDTTPHAMESVARGVQEANYKIVIVPYREYQRSGTRGAFTSVLRGIPVAIGAPTSGAAEAISYSLLGVRNQIRPDIRREDEAAQRGLQYGD